MYSLERAGLGFLIVVLENIPPPHFEKRMCMRLAPYGYSESPLGFHEVQRHQNQDLIMQNHASVCRHPRRQRLRHDSVGVTYAVGEGEMFGVYVPTDVHVPLGTFINPQLNISAIQVYPPSSAPEEQLVKQDLEIVSLKSEQQGKQAEPTATSTDNC